MPNNTKLKSRMRIKMQKILESIDYISSLSYTSPNNHSNNKFKQKRPKVSLKTVTSVN